MSSSYDILYLLGQHLQMDYVTSTFTYIKKKFYEFYRPYENEWLGEDTQAPDVPARLHTYHPMKKTSIVLQQLRTTGQQLRSSLSISSFGCPSNMISQNSEFTKYLNTFVLISASPTSTFSNGRKNNNQRFQYVREWLARYF